MGNDYCRDSKLSKKVTGRRVPLMATDKALGSSLSKVMLKGDMNWTDFFLSQTLKQALLSLSFALFLSGLVKSLSMSTETELSNTSRGEKKKKNQSLLKPMGNQ